MSQKHNETPSLSQKGSSPSPETDPDEIPQHLIDIHTRLLARIDGNIERHRNQLRTASENDLHRIHLMIDLALSLTSRCLLFGDWYIIEESNALCNQARLLLANIDEGDSKLHLDIHLNEALTSIDYNTRAWSHFKSVIPFMRDVVAGLEEDHPYFVDALFVLSFALARRYSSHTGEGGNVSNLNEASAFLAIASQEEHQNHPKYYKILALLGQTHRQVMLHDDSRNKSMIEEMLEMGKRALALCTTDRPEYFDIMVTVGDMMHDLCIVTGSVTFNEECVVSLKEVVHALFLTNNRRESMAKMMNKVTSVYHLLANMTGRSSYLQQGLDYGQRSLKAHTVKEEQIAALLTIGNLGLSSFRMFGDLEKLEATKGVMEYALDLLSDAPVSQRLWGLINVGATYGTLYEVTGYRDDLDKSIALYREVVALRDAGTPIMLAINESNLALSLTCRYDIAGDPADLIEAYQFAQAAVEALPEGHVHCPPALSHLAGLLMRQYQVFSRATDLDLAINTLEKACGYGVRQSIPFLRDWTISLSEAYMQRHQDLTHSDYDLDRAVDLAKYALQVPSGDHPRKHEALYAVAATLRIRFQTRAEALDYEEAMMAQQEAVNSLPTGHTHRSRALFGLARLHLLSTSSDNLPTAMSLCSEAVDDISAIAHLTLKDATEILPSLEKVASRASFTREDRIQLLDLYRRVIALAPRVAYFGLDLQARLRALAKAENIALSAASQALLLAHPEVAIEVLEHGRGVFWSQGLRLRSQFDELPPEIAEKLSSVARRLELGAKDTEDLDVKGKGASEVEEQARKMRALSAEFQNSILETRSIPGYERFLLDDDYDTLAKAANKGPIVVLLAGAESSAAIILRDNVPANWVKLPMLPNKFIERSTAVVKESYTRERGAKRDSTMGLDADPDDLSEHLRAMKVSKGSDKMETMLSELWKHMMKPVVNALGLGRTSGRDRPRVWICPTGAFAMLPIHAAGTKTERCSDYFVASYTPTLKALTRARQGFHPPQKNDAKVLLAAVPVPFEGDWLPDVVSEIKMVKTAIPNSTVIPLPREADCTTNPKAGPTAQMVLDSIPEASILHLASHGTQDHENALNSGFMMKDARLTVSKLMSLNLPNAFLAILSACETAKGDHSQPDQNVHLAAAMLYVGFRSVVGTMWSMNDMDGPEVSKEIYAQLFGGDSNDLNPDDVPYALDAAVQALRAQGLHPSRWAPYIHIGM